jgi:hypothetical protein
MGQAGAQLQAGRRVVMLDLLTDSHETTLAQNEYTWRNISEILEDVGPRLEAVTVHYKLAEKSNAFAFKVTLAWSLDGETWNTTDVLAEVGTAKQGIGEEFTSTDKFGRLMRFQLGTTDGGSVEQGIVSVIVALRFYQGA